MYVYLSKLLPLLLLPTGLVLVLGGLSVVLRWWGKRRLAIACLAAAFALLWLSAMPWVAGGLYGRLESRFPPESLASIPESSCIVVLGGAVEAPHPPRGDVELKDAIDRVYKAAHLYRARKAGRVFVTAGNQPWAQPGPSEAALIGELLIEWGVPAAAIQLEGRSRNTRENAVNVKPLLEAAGCDRSLLVTSAAHMPRAVATFRAVGLRVYPVSTDVQVAHSPGYTPMDFLPDAGALAMTSAALREWMGQVIYRLRGWA